MCMSESTQAAYSITSPEQRIDLLDAIRGFALLGILLMNLEAFTGPILGAITGIDSSLQGIDRWADGFIYILVQGKFWTLFSLLFGIGFALMFERAKQVGGDFVRIYRRRLFALLGIGLIHLLLIWEGDILFTYALAGFVLLRWLKSGKTSSLGAIIGLYCVPLLLLAVVGFFSHSNTDEHNFLKETTKQTQILGHSSYRHVLQWRFEQFSQDMASNLFLLPMTVAMFALGVRFYRHGLVKPLASPNVKALGQAAALSGTGLGLMLISVWVAPEINPTHVDRVFAVVNILNMLAGPLMCTGYFLGLRYIWSLDKGQKLLRNFVALGRMALSNYLAQSIICTLIFYGYGLAYYQQLSRVWHIPFAVGLISVQCLYSRYWLRHYTMGPVEYIWRWLTYRKRPKFVL
jgi:uncharacterized protein